MAFFAREKPEYVVMAAARVGGILANATYPADFISDNLAIQNNLIGAAHLNKVKRLVFLGSSCIYPRDAPQPLKEEHLLTGPLEVTNQWYAIAKIAGTKMCEAYRKQYGDDFITLMPTNLYGPGDNFDVETSHVLAALIRKFHEALPGEPVTLWGTGTPRREFLYSDALADAVVFVLEHPSESLHKAAVNGMLNVGVGEDLTISQLAELIRHVLGSRSEIRYDLSKPNGTPRKLLDVSRLVHLGWEARSPLEEGIRRTYKWYLENVIGELPRGQAATDARSPHPPAA
jgi:GDP-L-fucose synthase